MNGFLLSLLIIAAFTYGVGIGDILVNHLEPQPSSVCKPTKAQDQINSIRKILELKNGS